MSPSPIASGANPAEASSQGGTEALSNRRLSVSKRLVDLIVACAAMVLLSPILLAAAVMVKLTGPGPVFFRQTRIGQAEKPFVMLKLRTMHVGRDDSEHRDLNRRELLGDPSARAGDGVFKPQHDTRITEFGRFLRRFSIDELPQLFNVLKGEMSLVGPRPSLPWEVELYSMEQRRRHQCLPGITGLWQVSGRNSLSMPEMLALDVAYVDQQSLSLDLKILLRTPYAVLFDRSAR
jgi:lipopolysaccharide/colanic/teichoic acid biosynthesis glycosyltransferase